jgi:hypothetical protein
MNGDRPAIGVGDDRYHRVDGERGVARTGDFKILTQPRQTIFTKPDREYPLTTGNWNTRSPVSGSVVPGGHAVCVKASGLTSTIKSL